MLSETTGVYLPPTTSGGSEPLELQLQENLMTLDSTPKFMCTYPPHRDKHTETLE